MKNCFKIVCLSVFLGLFFGIRIEAQESVVVWSSSETGRAISQDVSMNIKTKAPESVTGATVPFAKVLKFSKPESEKENPSQVQNRLTPPMLVSVPQAIPYPQKAVRRGWEGKVVLAYEVLPDGSVGRIEPVQSSGHALLDQAARDAVKKWKYQPASKNGKPVTDIVEMPVAFQLKD